MANLIIRHLRVVTGAAQLKRLSPESTLWQLRYLTDDEQELEEDPALVRGLGATAFQFSYVIVTGAVWNAVGLLPPGYVPPTWDEILLDGTYLLPEVGAALVLAAAGLETLISQALQDLASRSTIRPDLWEWINDRPDWRQEPTVEEQFDVLLRMLAGKSLKDEPLLWEAFRNIRGARNSFMHEGIARIGKQVLSAQKAGELLQQAHSIAEWVEMLLPPEVKRPRVIQTHQIQITHAYQA